MKKVLLTLLCLVGAFAAFAAQETVTLDFSNSGWDLPTDYVNATASYTCGSYTITCNPGTDGSGWKKQGTALLIGKKDASVVLPVFDKAVEKISFAAVTGSSGKVKYNIYCDDTAVSTECTGCTSAHDFTIAEANRAANTQYTIKVTNSNNAQFGTITFYFVEEITEPTLTASADAVDFGSMLCGATPAAQEVNITGLNLTAAPTYSWVTPENNNFNVSSNLTEEGGTLTFSVLSTAFAGEYTNTLTVTADDVEVQIAVSATVVALEGTGEGTLASPYDVARAIALINNSMNTSDNVYVKGLISSISSVDVSKYYNATYDIVDNEGDANALTVYRGKYLDNANFESADQIQVNDEVVVYGELTLFNTTPEVAQGNYIVSLTRDGQAVVEPVESELAWSEATATVKFGADDNVFPTLTNPNSLDVTYSSSDEEVATIATDGSIELLATGTTVITAEFAGNEEYKAASVSYTLNVIPSSIPGEACDVLNAESFGVTSGFGSTYAFKTYAASSGVTYKIYAAFVAADDMQFNINSSRYSAILVTGNSYNYELTKVEFTYTSSGGKDFGVYTSDTAWTGEEGSKGFNSSTSWPSGDASWTATAAASTTVTVNIDTKYVKYPAFRPTAGGATKLASVKVYWQDSTTGIEAVEVEAGEAQYYNLQGVRVANPQGGIFIRVQGGKASKVIM